MRLLSAMILSGSLALATFAGGCGNAPSKGDCEKLLDHLIDLEIKQGGGDADMSDEMKAALEKQKAKVLEFARDEQGFIATCTQKTPKKVVECGLAAKDSCELQACDTKMSSDEMDECKKDLGGKAPASK
jgi:hypothetical protein